MICYQCDRVVDYLFDDARCKDCTRLTREEIEGNIKPFVLYTWQDTPIYCGLLMRRTYPVLGRFDTYNDACGYAFNVCGFATSNDFFINEEHTS